MTPAFIRDGLVAFLDRSGLVPPGTDWDPRWLTGGASRRAMGQMAAALGYRRVVRQESVRTREGNEDGGWVLQGDTGTSLRAWRVSGETDLDVPARASPTRIAQRVLLAVGERIGLLANGSMARVLLSDPSRADSMVVFSAKDWRDQLVAPDGFRVLLALAGARGLPHLPAVLQAAASHQTRVTTELRRQAKEAITGFINGFPDLTGLDPNVLWRESLLLVYRLLFILKLESPTETGQGFSFAATRLWRSALSPSHALGPLVRRNLDRGVDTGRMLETGLRTCFAVFRDGLSCFEIEVAALGGGLFGADTTPLLDGLDWGDRAVAILLDRLIWITGQMGERVRVHYGSLDVEDLGSVYETLLEQEPHIATEPMMRVRRGKIEAVVSAGGAAADIPAGRFFLRVGRGR